MTFLQYCVKFSQHGTVNRIFYKNRYFSDQDNTRGFQNINNKHT